MVKEGQCNTEWEEDTEKGKNLGVSQEKRRRGRRSVFKKELLKLRTVIHFINNIINQRDLRRRRRKRKK